MAGFSFLDGAELGLLRALGFDVDKRYGNKNRAL